MVLRIEKIEHTAAKMQECAQKMDREIAGLCELTAQMQWMQDEGLRQVRRTLYKRIEELRNERRKLSVMIQVLLKICSSYRQCEKRIVEGLEAQKTRPVVFDTINLAELTRRLNMLVR